MKNMESDKSTKMDMTKACIITGAIGAWYPQGQKRLINSLHHHGFAGDIISYTNSWPDNGLFDPACPYTIKAALLEEAIDRGYQHIMWLDCSMWAIRNPNTMFDIIAEHGYYFVRSGFNCAQSSSDKALDIMGITRDTAETWPEVWSCIFGIDMNNPIGKRWAEYFLYQCRMGGFHGSREHDGQSQDKRFMFHRQDQTAASLAYHLCGMTELHSPGDHMAYQEDGKDQSNLFFLMRGL